MKIEDLHDVETRETDHATGGQKGSKDTMVGALDPVALLILGRVAGMGAKKYAAFNFLKGYDWSLSYNALLRHLFLWLAGETVDAESGLPHMAHAMWHAHTLVGFEARGIGNDDRAPRLPQLDAESQVAEPLEPVDPWRGTRCAFMLPGFVRCGDDWVRHDGSWNLGHEYMVETSGLSKSSDPLNSSPNVRA